MMTRRKNASSRVPYLDAIVIASGGLPLGWEMRLDSGGRPYYLDHFDLEVARRRPDTRGMRSLYITAHENLPFGWEMRADRGSFPYYVNHFSRTWTRERPRLEDADSNLHNLDTMIAETESLPPGWQLRLTPKGCPYYVNPLTCKISQERPLPGGTHNLDTTVVAGEKLPFGWGMRLTPEGHPYYVDHFIGRETQQRPCLEDGDFNFRLLDIKVSGITNLPFGWELCLTSEGCPYYQHLFTHTTTLQRPRFGNTGLDPRYIDTSVSATKRLPAGWGMNLALGQGGRPYYINHNIRMATWQRPGLAIMEHAELDSIPRRPVPRCHPGTRIGLIEEIMEWLFNESVDCDMTWVNGPAGAGKTALAQTIGEKLAYEFGTLGAALFLSRACLWNDPSLFWASIVDQLTGLLEGYGQAVEAYTSNPSAIREWSIRTQFDTLLYEPLSTLERQQKIVILVDGLDECQGEEEQCEIIECILKALRGPGRLPVRWLIFSRPEPHLKRVFGAAESENLCYIKEVAIDDPETQSDIRLYLTHEFSRIAERRSYLHNMPEGWPSQDEFDKIFYSTSGLFVIAATFLRFIGDPTLGDPVSQLQVVIDFLAGAPNTKNPLDCVDNMYREIILRGLPELLPVSLDILGICAVCPPLPVLYFSYLIGSGLQRVYAALRSLHSVIAVPSEHKVAEEPLRYFHASFTDFLTNPNRSQDLAQDPRARRIQLMEVCFGVMRNTEVLYARGLSESLEPDDIDASSPLSISYHLSIFASSHIWEICALIPNPDQDLLLQTVCALDFRRLKAVCETILPRPFVDFLRWFHKYTEELPELANIVRTLPLSDTETKFIHAFKHLSSPLDLTSQPDEKELESPRYALLGIDEQTVAILVTHETVMVYSAEDVDDL